MARAHIELHRGELHVPGSGLWLDARRRAPCAFVSHAHGDHIGRHDRTIATPATLALMAHRLGNPRKGEWLPAGYREPFGIGELTVELFPAGHVLGSAQIRISRDGHAVGYSGDLCLEPTLTAEPAQVVECDTLVLESTFGAPRYVFRKASDCGATACPGNDNSFAWSVGADLPLLGILAIRGAYNSGQINGETINSVGLGASVGIGGVH